MSNEAARSWAGRLWLGSGRALFVGPTGDTAPHGHHAMQLCVSRQGGVEMEVEGVQLAPEKARWIAANVSHRICAADDTAALYYVEPESVRGRSVANQLGGRKWLALDAHTGRRLVSAIEAVDTEAAMDCIDAALGTALELPSGGDAAVARARAILQGALDDIPRVADVAASLGLSQRTLSRRFRQESGLSIRAYVLWLRIGAAARALAAGHNVTSAAYAAGFSDAAHLSRTFVRMFGIPPVAVVGRSRVAEA